jgi:hypothetical protein
LNSFRAALSALQAQVNQLDSLKADYYQAALTHEEEVSDFVLEKVTSLVSQAL